MTVPTTIWHMGQSKGVPPSACRWGDEWRRRQTQRRWATGRCERIGQRAIAAAWQGTCPITRAPHAAAHLCSAAGAHAQAGAHLARLQHLADQLRGLRHQRRHLLLADGAPVLGQARAHGLHDVRRHCGLAVWIRHKLVDRSHQVLLGGCGAGRVRGAAARAGLGGSCAAPRPGRLAGQPAAARTWQ